ncbi:MAG TPA: putative dsRNA-binding protein, partial [Caulobacter sp.]|nr:putative dsRNA-binding protein [Caulobacter sp.]
IGGRETDSILAGAAEALMAALYRDGGLETARRVFLDLWADEFERANQGKPRDPKTALQEWAQGRGKPLPTYRVLDRTGPDHAPVFTVEASVKDVDPAIAKGKSRQEAEKAAAKALLEREGALGG